MYTQYIWTAKRWTREKLKLNTILNLLCGSTLTFNIWQKCSQKTTKVCSRKCFLTDYTSTIQLPVHHLKLHLKYILRSPGWKNSCFSCILQMSIIIFIKTPRSGYCVHHLYGCMTDTQTFLSVRRNVIRDTTAVVSALFPVNLTHSNHCAVYWCVNIEEMTLATASGSRLTLTQPKHMGQNDRLSRLRKNMIRENRPQHELLWG